MPGVERSIDFAGSYYVSTKNAVKPSFTAALRDMGMRKPFLTEELREVLSRLKSVADIAGISDTLSKSIAERSLVLVSLIPKDQLEEIARPPVRDPIYYEEDVGAAVEESALKKDIDSTSFEKISVDSGRVSQIQLLRQKLEERKYDKWREEQEARRKQEQMELLGEMGMVVDPRAKLGLTKAEERLCGRERRGAQLAFAKERAARPFSDGPAYIGEVATAAAKLAEGDPFIYGSRTFDQDLEVAMGATSAAIMCAGDNDSASGSEASRIFSVGSQVANEYYKKMAVREGWLQPGSGLDEISGFDASSVDAARTPTGAGSGGRGGGRRGKKDSAKKRRSRSTGQLQEEPSSYMSQGLMPGDDNEYSISERRLRFVNRFGLALMQHFKDHRVEEYMDDRASGPNVFGPNATSPEKNEPKDPRVEAAERLSAERARQQDLYERSVFARVIAEHDGPGEKNAVSKAAEKNQQVAGKIRTEDDMARSGRLGGLPPLDDDNRMFDEFWNDQTQVRKVVRSRLLHSPRR